MLLSNYLIGILPKVCKSTSGAINYFIDFELDMGKYRFDVVMNEAKKYQLSFVFCYLAKDLSLCWSLLLFIWWLLKEPFLLSKESPHFTSWRASLRRIFWPASWPRVSSPLSWQQVF